MKEPYGPGAKRTNTVIGWRELVGLPDLGIPQLRAKIDTGARTSALHAVDITLFEKDAVKWAEFHVPSPGRPWSERCRAIIVDDRMIKNTSGIARHRYVVKTTLVLGTRRWRIEVSLADRANMEFDLILGRTAIRKHHLLVNPGSSYLLGPPSLKAPLPARPNNLGPRVDFAGDGSTRHPVHALGEEL